MSYFERDEVIKELREGYIVFIAYAINKNWWEMFWNG